MLNLNVQQVKVLAAEPIWKILIYDRVGQDIISPIISIKELRELGVTLHVYVSLLKKLYYVAITLIFIIQSTTFRSRFYTRCAGHLFLPANR